MTPPPTIQAWAIKAPDGWLLVYTASREKRLSIAAFMEHDYDHLQPDWKGYEESGFRCVRVQITEVQE